MPATRGDKEHALRCTVGLLLMCYIHIASHDVFIALAGISRANRELYMTELVTLLELCRFICRFVVGGRYQRVKFSKWIKADLHIHTDWSLKTKQNSYQGRFSVDVLLGKLKEHNVDMISLTDHNIINVDAYEEIMSKCGDIRVLVGVELDVALTFDDLTGYVREVTSHHGRRISRKPFHVLVIFRSSDFRTTSSKLEDMFSAIGTRLQIDLNSQKTLRVTTIEFIVQYFKEEDFFLIAHGDKDRGIVESCKDPERVEEAQYEILVGGISALEMTGSARMTTTINKWNENFNKLLASGFRMKSPTTYVVFSDNHNCQEYCPRTFQTWFKGDASFETLRLAFSDPESRVHTSTHPPSHVSDYIEHIELKLKNNDQSQSIYFSPYLNVIIGGRSSGKSLLFNTLVGLNNEFGESEKSEYKNIYADLIEHENTKVKLFTTTKLDDRYSLVGHAYYQESIIKLFDDVESLGERLKHEFPNVDEAFVKKTEEHVEELFRELGNAYERYFEVANRIDRGSINRQIEIALRKSNKLFDIDLSELRTPDNSTHYAKLKRVLEESMDKLNELKALQHNGSPLFDVNDIEQIEKVVSLVAERYSYVESCQKREQIRLSFKRRVQQLIGTYVEQELSQEKKLIEDTRKKLDEDLDVYQLFFETKLQLKRACEALRMINIVIPDQVNHKYKYSFVTRVNLDINYPRIISEFFSDKILSYDSNADLFQNMVALASSDKPNVRLKHLTSDGKNPKRLRDKLDEFVQTIKSQKVYEIIEKGPDGTEIRSSCTSQGKQASIFLDITLNNLLEDSNSKVLLIDQPEDNIDNRFISRDIVNLLRRLKNRVQVILVTHNASIAIYGDAENIIIAENDGGVIRYRQGGLEDERIREDACMILDGGEVAFKNRMDKYNIEVLLREDD